MWISNLRPQDQKLHALWLSQLGAPNNIFKLFYQLKKIRRKEKLEMKGWLKRHYLQLQQRQNKTKQNTRKEKSQGNTPLGKCQILKVITKYFKYSKAIQIDASTCSDSSHNATPSLTCLCVSVAITKILNKRICFMEMVRIWE